MSIFLKKKKFFFYFVWIRKFKQKEYQDFTNLVEKGKFKKNILKNI